MKAIELTGRRFGELLVLKRHGSDNRGKATWLCKCNCGNYKIAKGYALRAGHTSHCGCLLGKHISESTRRYDVHDTRLYHIWSNMKTRCTNPKCEMFYRYGGRGITICDEWFNSFGAFQSWAFTHGYSDSLTLDRIDNNGNYEPSNCRFVSVQVQANNRVSSRWVSAFGETDTMANMARKYSLPYYVLQRRLDNGLEPEKALTIPLGGGNV